MREEWTEIGGGWRESERGKDRDRRGIQRTKDRERPRKSQDDKEKMRSRQTENGDCLHDVFLNNPLRRHILSVNLLLFSFRPPRAEAWKKQCISWNHRY